MKPYAYVVLVATKEDEPEILHKEEFSVATFGEKGAKKKAEDYAAKMIGVYPGTHVAVQALFRKFGRLPSPQGED